MPEKTGTRLDGAQWIGSLVLAVLVGGLVTLLVFGVPYLSNRLTRPAAGSASNPDSLNGVWVGQVRGNDPVAASDFLSAGQRVGDHAVAQPLAMMVEVHTSFGPGIPKFTGTLTVCDAKGNTFTGGFRNEPMLTTSKLEFLVRGGTQLEGSHLNGELTPGKLRVSWDYASEQRAAGSLAKGQPADFQPLCQHLR